MRGVRSPEVNAATAGKANGTPQSTAEFAVAWDANGFYFACRVFDPNPEGASLSPFDNDACELFLGSSPPTGSGSFRPNDLQLVVDYKNLADAYGNGGERAMPPGVITRASIVAGGFVVELSVPANDLNPTMLESASDIFEVQIDDCQAGVAQAGVLCA